MPVPDRLSLFALLRNTTLTEDEIKEIVRTIAEASASASAPASALRTPPGWQPGWPQADLG